MYPSFVYIWIYCYSCMFILSKIYVGYQGFLFSTSYAFCTAFVFILKIPFLDVFTFDFHPLTSIHPSIHPSVHPSTHPSVHPSTHPSMAWYQENWEYVYSKCAKIPYTVRSLRRKTYIGGEQANFATGGYTNFPPYEFTQHHRWRTKPKYFLLLFNVQVLEHLL